MTYSVCSYALLAPEMVSKMSPFNGFGTWSRVSVANFYQYIFRKFSLFGKNDNPSLYQSSIFWLLGKLCKVKVGNTEERTKKGLHSAAFVPCGYVYCIFIRFALELSLPPFSDSKEIASEIKMRCWADD